MPEWLTLTISIAAIALSLISFLMMKGLDRKEEATKKEWRRYDLRRRLNHIVLVDRFLLQREYNRT